MNFFKYTNNLNSSLQSANKDIIEEFLNVFEQVPQVLENVVVKDKNIINSARCKNAIRVAKNLIRKKGRMLVRKSGTEPKIRIMVESHNKKLVNKCINLIKKTIK